MIYYFSRKNLLLLGQSTQRASSITPVTRSHLSNSHNLLLVVQSLSRIQLCDPCELHHARLLCPPLSPRVCSKSCPLSQCCYLTISSSAALFSFCLQSFPASESFLISAIPGQTWGQFQVASLDISQLSNSAMKPPRREHPSGSC